MTRVGLGYAPARITGLYIALCLLWIWLSDRALVWLGYTDDHAFLAAAGKGTAFVAVTAAILFWLVRRSAISLARDLSQRNALEADRRLAEFAISRASVASYLIAPDARILRVNQATCEMLGYSEDELTRMTVHDIDIKFPPDVWLRHWAELRDRKHMRFESVSRHRDGHSFPVEIEINYLEFDSREYNVAFALDITYRRLAEMAVRESAERLNSAVEVARLGVIVVDYELQTADLSPRAAEHFGLTPAVPVARVDLHARFHPDDRAELERLTASALEPSGTGWFNLEHRVVRPDGATRWLNVRKRVTFAHDRPVRAVVVTQDVTERRLAEVALRASEVRYRLLFESNPHPMWVYDVDSLRFLAVNDAAVLAYGHTRDEFLAMTIRDIRPTDDVSKLESIVSQLTPSPTRSSQWRHLRKDGAVFHVDVSSHELKDGGGRSRLVLALDINERLRAEEDLRASERRLRLVLEAAGAVAFTWDIEGDVVTRYFSTEPALPATTERLGTLAEVRACVHPDDVLGFDARLSACLADGIEYGNEYRVVHPDGTTASLEEYGYLTRTADGLPLRLTGMSIDVSERVAATEALRESEARLRLALEAGQMGTFDWDLATNAVVWSDTHYTLFGYPPGDRFPVEYRHFADRLHPDDRARVEANLAAAREGRTYANECRIILPDGTVRWVQGLGEFTYAGDGRPVRMLGTAQDITDRKRAEAELIMRDRAIQALSQGIVITDPTQPDNPIIYVSPGFERLSGYSAAEVVGRNCRFMLGKDTDKAESKRLGDAIRAGDAYTGELLNYRKDGTTFWNALSIAPVRDADGRLTQFIGIETDISVRRQLEDQFRQAQKMEAVGQLAGGVAHDFNNLLTIINGYSELLMMSDLPTGDHQRESVVAIRDAGERAARLTQQLLAFSRKAIIEPKVIDLNELVAESAKLLRRLIGEDIILTVVTCPTPIRIKADPGQLEQVLMNLMVNARDAMPTGGRLTIETTTVAPGAGDATPFAHLSVSDNGQGMTDEVKGKIFEPFFTTKGVGKGTGLGLAVVQGVVIQNGGRIEIESAVGVGTTFRLLLPLVNVEVAGTAAETTRLASEGDETVLLVEDEEAVRMVARISLEMQGYTVLEADGGAEAARHAKEHPGEIHLLVSDVVMPEMGGRQLLEAVRQHRPGVRVLFMSGYTDDAVLLHGVIEATDAFIHKPFTPLALARKVREVIDGGAASRP